VKPFGGNVAGFSTARAWFKVLSCASATAFDTPGFSLTMGAMNWRSVRVGESGSQNP